MKLKFIIQAALVVTVVVLIYFIYTSLQKPIKFEEEFEKRKTETVVKLKEIRTLEEAFKQANGRYCSDIDSLVAFLKTGRVALMKLQKVSDYPDTISESEAIKRGFIKRDTVYVNPLEKLREDKKISMSDAQMENLKIIPFSEGEKFEVKVGAVERNGMELPVFEVVAPFTSLLKGMDEQMVANKIAEIENQKKYPGWKVGSMEEPVTDGNFE